MDYTYEKRRRRERRRNHSTSPHEFLSSRDDEEIEQEIIDRAMDIERSREKRLRRQFEYIVYNVKKLERRRQLRHRTRSPNYYNDNSNSSYHLYPSPDAIHHHSYRLPSPERLCQRKHRSSSRIKHVLPYQITMIYRTVGTGKHGDEIMVLQENHIVFKGFLRPAESFTFKFECRHDLSAVKLEFFINELFECCLIINCQQERIQQVNELFQIENIQPLVYERRHDTTKETSLPSTLTKPFTNHYNQNLHRRPNSLSRFENEERDSSMVESVERQYKPRSHQRNTMQQQLSDDQKRIILDSSNTKQRSEHNSSPSQLSLVPSNGSRNQSRDKNKTSNLSSIEAQSDVSISKQNTLKPTDQKNQEDTQTNFENDDDNDNEDNLFKEPTIRSKTNYGPPQVSTFVRSDSDSSSDDSKSVNRKENEKIDQKDETSESSPKRPSNNDENNENNDSEGLTNFLQLLQIMSGGSLRTQTSNDDSDGIQGLLARLGIVTQQSSQKKTIHLTPREIGNVENYILIYLDTLLTDNSLISQLRSLVNYLRTFDDADDCIAYMNSISNEKIIIISSDKLGESVVSRTQDLQQLFAVYILCETIEQTDNWSKNQPKIRGAFADINDIIRQLKQDIENDEENILPFTHTLTRNNKGDQLFIMNQIIKEILLDPDEMQDAKKELIDFCQTEYKGNVQQLELIDELENEYSKEKIFKYFQKNTFIYKMLNKGFRIPEVDVLFKLRLCIQNLHHQINSSAKDSSIKKIYRSQILTNDEFDLIKSCNNGGFVSFSNFFLASTLCSDNSFNDTFFDRNHQQHVIFEIDVSHTNNLMLFNDKILVTFGLVTRVETIDKQSNGKTVVHLTTINIDDRQYEAIVEPIRKETRAPHPALRLVKLFIELEQYSQAVRLGQHLLADLPGARKDPLLALARIYHSLGTTLYEKEEYDQALDVIKKSYEIYLRFLPEDAPQLSPTWNNMGSIYLRQGKTDLALEYHERALSIQLKSPSPDLPSIISYSNNIGGVYLKLERYDEALIHFKRALQIEEQTLPSNHPELAGTYHRIGGVYFRQNNYEKALEYYDKTLEIELASLPDNHPTVAVTYHNRGTAFEGLGRLDEAVESAEKAVERLLKTLPKEHPQVRMNQAYVDRLKQKLWVKQLFSS